MSRAGKLVRPGGSRYQRWLLDRDGQLTVTVPEKVQASADELGPALAAG
jgi:hypothetical protein